MFKFTKLKPTDWFDNPTKMAVICDCCKTKITHNQIFEDEDISEIKYFESDLKENGWILEELILDKKGRRKFYDFCSKKCLNDFGKILEEKYNHK